MTIGFNSEGIHAMPMDEAGDGTGTPGAGGGAPSGDGAAGASGTSDWLSSVSNEELRSWGATKGWTGVEGALQSARHLETMIGAPADQVVRLPQGGIQFGTEDHRTLMGRLGMPASGADYDMAIPDNLSVDENYMNWARETFHKAGLTGEQAKFLNNAHSEFMGNFLTSENNSQEANLEAGDQNLRQAWGNGYNSMIAQGTAAVNALGITGPMLDGMEAAIGYEATMKWAADLGGRLGEDKFVAGGQGPDGGGFNHGMTPEQGQAAWNAKLGDQAFVKALQDRMHPGHKQAMKEKSDLFKVIHPE